MSQAPLDEEFASPGPGTGTVVPEDRMNRGTNPAPEGVAVEDLLWVIPRFVERTTKQIELARLLASHIPCIGSLIPGGSSRPTTPSGYSASVGEPVDVLDVLAHDPPQTKVEGENAATGEEAIASSTSSDASGAAADAADDASPGESDARPELTEIPDEGELAVSSYDSLAASQVVPRLATLTKVDLARILAYEQAHRNRQTIIHRVRQLLDQ